MQTLKTAIVVVLLLFVIYGGFIALNGSNNTSFSPEIEGLDLSTDAPDITGVTGPVAPAPAALSSSSPAAASPADPWAKFQSAPSPGFNNSASPTPASPLLAGPASSGSTPLPGLPVSASPSPLPTLPSSPSDVALPSLPTLPPAAGNDVAKPGNGLQSLPPLPPSLAGAADKEATKAVSTDDDTKTTDSPDFGIALPSSLPASTAGLPKSNASELLTPKSDSTNPSKEDSDSADAVPAADSKPIGPSKSYENAKETALSQSKRGQLREALATLSLFYNDNELTTEQRQDLVDFLDALAGEVVYSRQHYLDIAYFPVPGETLEDVAKKFEVPAEILARINAIEPKGPLQTGTRLKVVPGPFRAEIDLSTSELTLFVGDLYAGRYPVTLGKDPAPKPGDYKVVDKQKDRNYYGNGAPIPGSDPRNPYGGFWIDLGGDLCIHGSSPDASGSQGCISLSPQDAADVYGMLSHGSPIVVRK